MAATPWLTSNSLIDAVKRKIAFPISQVTFSNNDVLAFANEEMMVSQVPSVLEFHEEYFVYTLNVPMVSNVSRYAIPDRAVGMRLRDVKWMDSSGNMFDMTRIQPEDKAFFQLNIGANQAIHKFYVEGNDIVISPAVVSQPTGSLVMSFFLRPNQLVVDERAAIIEHFSKDITIDNTTLIAGDTLSITIRIVQSVLPPIGNPPYQSFLPGSFVVTYEDVVTLTAVSGSPGTNEFQIGVTSAATAANLATALIAQTGIIFNATSISDVIHIQYDNIQYSFRTSNEDAIQIPTTTQGIDFISIPIIFQNGVLIDFLQTKPGHKIYSYDKRIPANGIGGNTIVFNADDVPVSNFSSSLGLVPGDYICLENECIIPGIPPDLHSGLAERTSARILASLGDAAGLQTANEKIQEINQRQGTLLDDRVEGTPQKVTARHSLLRYGKMGTRRRT